MGEPPLLIPRYLFLFYRHTQGHGMTIRSLHTAIDTGLNIRYVLVTSLKCKMLIRLDIHQRPSTNLFSTPFLLKILSYSFRPNQSSLISALPLQVVPSTWDTPLYCFYLLRPLQRIAPFLYRCKTFIHPEFLHVPLLGSFPSTVTFQKRKL